MLNKYLLTNFAVAIVLIGMPSLTNAEVILADELNDVAVIGPSNTSASIGSWDTVTGVTAPSTTLTFQNGTDGTTTLTSGEVLPNNNMTAGGWDTSIVLDLDGSTQSIDLTSLVIDFRLANSAGADNTTQNKSGQVLVELSGSSSGVLGTVDLGGNQSYPTVQYTRTLDLTGLPSLDTSETYTFTIQARGIDWGHFRNQRQHHDP